MDALYKRLVNFREREGAMPQWSIAKVKQVVNTDVVRSRVATVSEGASVYQMKSIVIIIKETRVVIMIKVKFILIKG